MRTIEGKPIEEVLFLRDEMANLAWGVERLAEGLSGRSVNRREAYLEAQHLRDQPAQPATEQDMLTWRLATEVPDYWIPLIPVQKKTGESRSSSGAAPRSGRMDQSVLNRLKARFCRLARPVHSISTKRKFPGKACVSPAAINTRAGSTALTFSGSAGANSQVGAKALAACGLIRRRKRRIRSRIIQSNARNTQEGSYPLPLKLSPPLGHGLAAAEKLLRRPQRPQ